MDLLDLLTGTKGGWAPGVRQTGVRSDYGLSTATGISPGARSAYERTMAPGQRRTPEELQQMLAEVILAAGGAVVPGVGPKAQARQAPGSSGRPKSIWEMSRSEFLGKPIITTRANAADLKPTLTRDAAAAPPEPFRGSLTLHRGDHFYVVMDGSTPVARYNGDTLVVAPKYRKQGIATDLVYAFRTDNPSVPPAETRTRASQRVQERVWERIEAEKSKRAK